jgi:hypothetical protein
MSTNVDHSEWFLAKQQEFKFRPHAVLGFFPELKSVFLDLVEHEPFKGRVVVHVAEEDPYLLTVSAGLFDLKFAADVFGDIIFYSFTSALLKRVICRESAIFHYGQMKLKKTPWGVIDGPGEGVHKFFVEAPQSVQFFSLADQVARWGLEQLFGGYASIVALEEAVAKTKEAAVEKEARRDSAGSE